MFKHLLAAGVAAASLATSLAWAQATPVGVWKTFDEQTGEPKALIRITENNGEFSGRVEKLFRAATPEPNPVCIKCDGPHKNQPIIGMTILTGMQKGDGREYAGGRIIDPASGKIYKSVMTLSENGKKLDVRGYIGMPMLGRTQIWERVE